MYLSVFKPNLFADKHIIVTGGGRGIGRCTVHELPPLGLTSGVNRAQKHDSLPLSSYAYGKDRFSPPAHTTQWLHPAKSL